MIPEAFIQELLARVDIVDVVGRYVKLRKGGANLVGLCPFHNEKTASFTVSPSKQFYHCFGCGAHGSAIHFLTEHTGASFPEAVRTLAASVGMTVPDDQRSARDRAADRARRDARQQARDVLQRAQNHYRAALKHAPDAIAYLKGRGLTGTIAARFGLGWASAQRRGLAQVFPHYDDAALIESGLVVEAEDGQRHDRFRGRVMFPIHDARGQLIGFGGRLIERGEPKYLNSPETPLFSKGHELYGLHQARRGVHAEGCVLVVEGYMDVVALAQYGVENAVATLGTATTTAHLQALRRLTDCVVFSFDGDAAGRKAAWRALQTCLPWVAEDFAIRFLFLPAEHDPDSFVRTLGAPAWREAVHAATPLSQFLLDELQARHALDSVEGRAACVHEARPLIAQMPAGGFRLQLERELAQRVRLTPDELQGILDAPGAAATPASAPAAPVVRRPVDVDVNDPAPAVAGLRAAPAEVFTGAPSTRASRLSVTPLARRLLSLLLAHPQLAGGLGDRQLELLARHPHLRLVSALVAVIGQSGATHAGALLQAVEPHTDLGRTLHDLSTTLLSDELPRPQAEWDDALRSIEQQTLQAECDRLVAEGLHDEAQRRRYQALSRRLARLKGAHG